jgi:hypothetical protein
MKKYKVKSRESVKNSIGEVSAGYDEGRDVEIDIQPVTSKLTAEMYGERVNNIRVGYTADMGIKESDGVCVEVGADDEPDYVVIGVKKWTSHTVIDIEKR